MKTIKQIAQEATSLSHVTRDRTKISNEDIINEFGGHFAIDEFDRINAKGMDGKYSDVYVYHLAGTEFFAFAGFVISKIFDNILEEYEGDYTAANAELATVPLHLVMKSGVTRGGRRIAIVEVE